MTGRRAERVAAQSLNNELHALNKSRVRFHARVAAYGPLRRPFRRGLELLVWPEAGLDNFIEPVFVRPRPFGPWREVQTTTEAVDRLRGIASRYIAGERPPFKGGT